MMDALHALGRAWTRFTHWLRSLFWAVVWVFLGILIGTNPILNAQLTTMSSGMGELAETVTVKPAHAQSSSVASQTSAAFATIQNANKPAPQKKQVLVDPTKGAK